MLYLSDRIFDLFKIVIFIAAFIELPGLIIHRLYLHSKTFISEDLGLAFAIGAGVFVFFSFICYCLQLTLSFAITAYAIVIISSLIFFKFVYKRQLSPHRFDIYDLAFFVLFLLLAFILRNLYCLADDNTSADYWYHLAQIRYLADTNVAKNVFPFFEKEIPQWLYPYNSFYLLNAMIAKVTRTDVLHVWIAMRFVLTFVFLSCTLSFLRILLEDKQKTILAMMLFILPFLYFPMESGIGGLTAMRYICYPKVGSLFIFLPAISICLLLFVTRKEGLGAIIAAALICIAFQNWHVANIMFVVIIVLAWFIGFGLKRQFQYLNKLTIFAISVVIVPLILFYFADYRVIHEAKTLYNFNSSYLSPSFYGATPILDHISHKWYITKSSYFFNFGNTKILSWMIVAAFVLPLSILCYTKNLVVHSFLLGFTLLPLFLAYNPLPVTIMVKYGAPFLVRRFLFVLPVACAFVFTVFHIFDLVFSKLSAQASRHKYIIAIHATIVLILCFPFLAPSRNRRMLNPAPITCMYGLKNEMQEHVPLGSMVLADNEMSCTLGALRQVKVVTGSKHIFDAMSPNHEERMEDLKFCFSKESNPMQRAETARKYGANYIVVQRSKELQIEFQGYKRIYQNRLFEFLSAEEEQENGQKS
jgi:hypothetical protein